MTTPAPPLAYHLRQRTFRRLEERLHFERSKRMLRFDPSEVVSNLERQAELFSAIEGLSSLNEALGEALSRRMPKQELDALERRVREAGEQMGVEVPPVPQDERGRHRWLERVREQIIRREQTARTEHGRLASEYLSKTPPEAQKVAASTLFAQDVEALKRRARVMSAGDLLRQFGKSGAGRSMLRDALEEAGASEGVASFMSRGNRRLSSYLRVLQRMQPEQAKSFFERLREVYPNLRFEAVQEMRAGIREEADRQQNILEGWQEEPQSILGDIQRLRGEGKLTRSQAEYLASLSPEEALKKHGGRLAAALATVSPSSAVRRSRKVTGESPGRLSHGGCGDRACDLELEAGFPEEEVVALVATARRFSRLISIDPSSVMRPSREM